MNNLINVKCFYKRDQMRCKRKGILLWGVLNKKCLRCFLQIVRDDIWCLIVSGIPQVFSPTFLLLMSPFYGVSPKYASNGMQIAGSVWQFTYEALSPFALVLNPKKCLQQITNLGKLGLNCHPSCKKKWKKKPNPPDAEA